MDRAGPPDQFPLTAGRILQLGWSIFRFAWRPIMGALTLAVLPAYVLGLAVDLVFGNRLYEWLEEVGRAGELGLPAPPRPPDFDTAVFASLLVDVVLFICSLIATAAVVAIVSRVYGGSRLGARDGLREAVGRLMSLIAGQLLLIVALIVVGLLGLMLAATFIVGGGFLAFIGLIALVGAVAMIVFIVVRASFTSIAIVLEHSGGADGIRRSWRMAADHGWRVLGYIVMVGLLGVLVTVAVSLVPTLVNPLPIGSVADTVYSGVVTAVADIIAAPIAPIVLTLLFYDLRWRHGERVPLPGGGEAETLSSEPER